MIDRVTAQKKPGGWAEVCQQIPNTASFNAHKWRCGHCGRGVLFTWYVDDRTHVVQDRKRCLVCKAKFSVWEIHR